ncbi:Aminomethyltransferase [Purpureocillium lavendulum]|uniref:Aminomethyltransferase n=1 Tax=Purpureocillium lavendulum TaxID=1247861 RepID=A0AB34G2C5_9HYPO|nr:Aminomethyltransferase [Purpureocillium lavendulum]
MAAPIVERTRSQSSPDIFGLPPFCLESPASAPATSHGDGALDWKSWGDLPAFEVPSFNSDFHLDTTVFTNRKEGQPAPDAEPHPTPRAVPVASQSASRPAPKDQTQEQAIAKPPPKPAALSRSKTGSLIHRPRSWLSSSSKSSRKSAKEERQSTKGEPAAPNPKPPAATPRPRQPERGLSGSSTLSSLSRWSWASPTRSPSPKNAPESTPPVKPLVRAATTTTHPKEAPGRLQLITDTQLKQVETPELAKPPAPSKQVARANSYFAKIKQKPPVLVSKSPEPLGYNHSCASSSTTLGGNRASNSDKSSVSQSTCSDGNTNTPVTDESSNDMTPHLRDPLWSSFKTLEVEIKQHGAKNAAQRVGQVKNMLLPFLRSTMDHKSTKTLDLEDVDQRATVLNKWWISILEMLDDKGQTPVPGVDRPILLEAATLLMMRSEWRLATSSFQPLAERLPSERVRSRSWTNASGSTEDSQQSAFLAESAEHNVRTMFVTNLVRQMSFVVDKMSMRHAPLSLVNFSGKACAYAFFFAPGVADILVRLWGLTPELIRRTADELGLPRKDTGESADITALFPPKLGTFGWRSARSTWDTLKQIPRMSLLVARIAWTGPWVSRWKGRDTDLFFIFCKYFHILSNQFMPPGLPLVEKARSPAFVLVHSQLLSILDTTIHRQTAIEHAYGPPLIDQVNGADATALAMPLPPTNLMKGMAENRLVILLRDVLTDDAPELGGARHTFAETFTALMKGATCRTSQFDSAACFTLCDFLEEAIMIFHEFESRDMSARYVDWDFWLDVCKRIMASLNTMSEVRMLSFLFAVWDAVTKNPRRKEALCLDWLLTEETFNAFFNNWCPMVRAYYHRLLCWRICRDSGNANDTDLKVMSVVAARLKTVWSHYLYLKRSAEESGRVPLSTVPMCPALGKKFMIIRQEASPPQTGLFMGFDTFARTNSSEAASWTGFPDTGFGGKGGDSKKRWSLLGKVLSMTAGSGMDQSATSDVSARNSLADSQSYGATRESAEIPSRSVGSTPAAAKAQGAASEPDAESPSEPDDQKYVFRFILGWMQHHNVGRDLTRPRLPAPAQAHVNARIRNSSVSSPTPTTVGTLTHVRRASGPRTTGSTQRDRRSSVNASVEEWLRGTPAAVVAPAQNGWKVSTSAGSERERRRSLAGEWSPATSELADFQDTPREPLTKAIKPVGMYARNAIYSGRALAEWSIVVNECNSFMDRRKEEGVARLADVEVPQLGVEGFRKAGAG